MSRLTQPQKVEIREKVFNFIQDGGLLRKDKFPILLKLESEEMIKSQDDFFGLLEAEIFRHTGIRPQWIVGGIEERKIWIGLTVSSSNIPNDSLTLHDQDYHFVVVI